MNSILKITKPSNVYSILESKAAGDAVDRADQPIRGENRVAERVYTADGPMRDRGWMEPSLQIMRVTDLKARVTTTPPTARNLQ